MITLEKINIIIVICIVPSFDRELKNLNEFLNPAVDELKALWKGVRLKSALSRFALKFCAAVLCFSSDVPATRKICGFKSHLARIGCSRCLKEFPGGFGEKEIILVLIEISGNPVQINTIADKLFK